MIGQRHGEDSRRVRRPRHRGITRLPTTGKRQSNNLFHPLRETKVAGLTQSQVARAENPDKGITLDQIVKIADGLGLVPVFHFDKL